MTPAQKAAQTRKEKQSQKERMAQVEVACHDEWSRVNRAINDGAVIILQTGFGPYELDGVQRFDYMTHPAGQAKTWSNTRTFMGCNDGQWASIMEQAQEPRHPFFHKILGGA